jgi:hypothetical protein
VLELANGGNDDVLGIIYSFIPKHIPRFFENGKTVFVKFIGRRAYRQLRPGSKLFFYEARSGRKIVGEARILAIDTSTPEEVVSKYSGQLFLTTTELEEYASKGWSGDRKSKEMLVLIVTNPRKYKTPLTLGKKLTMAGQYMTRKMFETLEKSQ